MDRATDRDLPDGVDAVADLVAGSPVSTPPAGPADEAPALRVAGADLDRRYEGAGFRTDVRKTANLLAHVGVREDRTLAVADRPSPETVLGFLGAALVGARVRFVPTDAQSIDARGYLAPVAVVGTPALPAGGQRIGYGGNPDDPTITHFEEQMWSENPTTPPPTATTADPLLVSGDGDGDVANGTLLRAAAGIVDDHALGAGDAVAVDAPFTIPGTVVAGVLAPILAGGSIVLVADRERAIGEGADWDLLVATGDEAGVDPRSVLD